MTTGRIGNPGWFLAIVFLPVWLSFGSAHGARAADKAPASSTHSGERLARIQKEEKRLLEIRQDLMRQIEVNRKIERAIDRDRKFAEKLESKKMQQLISIYEKMAPRTAASQINIMPRKLVAVLIAGMNPRKASRIMRFVDPATAVRITSDLASRPVSGQDLRRSP